MGSLEPPGAVVEYMTGEAVQADGDDTGAALFVQLTWREALPVEVTMVVGPARLGRDNPDVLEWKFARELFARDGGVGDVRITWRDGYVFVRLTNGDEAATVAIPAAVANAFLEDAQEIVPIGCEPSWLTDEMVRTLMGDAR